MKQYFLQQCRSTHRAIVFVFFAQLFSLTITATEVIVDNIKYNVVKKSRQATVIANNLKIYSGNVVIPHSIIYDNVEYDVTAVGASAFYYCNVSSVTIPNSVTSIGDEAFSGCTSLTSVTIPNSVKSIGYLTFFDCGSLTSVTIPNSVTSIGDGAFVGCISLTSVTIPNSVINIGNNAFAECTGLTSVTIGNSVTSIGEEAFYNCSSLTSITIPNSVTSIGSSAFCACSGLTSVTIPNSVTSIGESAFSDCSGLTKVEFTSIESLCKITFGNIYANPLTYAKHLYIKGQEVIDLVIPNSVISIGQYAFCYCSGLTSVTIGMSVEKIGTYAFANCEELMDVYCLAKKAPTAATTAFDGSYPNYITLHVIASVIEDYKAKSPWSSFGTIMAISGDDPSPKIQFADAAVKAICVDNWDINSDGELSEAEAAEVQYIGTRFKGNSKITSFNELQYFTGLTSIGDNTFYNCSSLTSVTIPNSVTSIERLAFSGCNSLTSVTIPNSVTTISGSAFWSCSGLTSVTIPNSVTSIEAGAFAGCGNLTTIKVVDDNPQYDSRDNSNAIIETSTNTLICGCKNTAIPKSVTSIGKAAFDSCSGLTSVIIPNNVISVGMGAFYECCNLTSVTIPKSVISIEAYAFSWCRNLTSVTCLAKQVPTTSAIAFNNSYLANSTLHVPSSAIEDYKATVPWSDFGTIVALEPTYILGDANGNGEVEIGDVTSVLTLMATPEATGYDNKAADANGNGEIEIGDVTTILTIMAGE